MEERLKEFIDYLDNKIDDLLCGEMKSSIDAMIKNAQALMLERDKNALINILAERR